MMVWNQIFGQSFWPGKTPTIVNSQKNKKISKSLIRDLNITFREVQENISDVHP